jgi:AcrR family transcriptional regulator
VRHNGGVTRRTRTATAELGDALVDAAAALLEAEGPEALTIRRVAAEAGVAPMSVYNRFGAKEGLLDEVFLRQAARLSEVCRAVDPNLGPIEQLQLAALAYRRFALDGPHGYALLFMKSIPDFEPSEESIRQCVAGFEQLVQLVRLTQAAGHLIDGDPMSLAEQLWATEHGLVALELVGIGFAADRLGHFCDTMDAVLRGIMTAPDTQVSSRSLVTRAAAKAPRRARV